MESAGKYKQLQSGFFFASSAAEIGASHIFSAISRLSKKSGVE